MAGGLRSMLKFLVNITPANDEAFDNRVCGVRECAVVNEKLGMQEDGYGSRKVELTQRPRTRATRMCLVEQSCHYARRQSFEALK